MSRTNRRSKIDPTTNHHGQDALEVKREHQSRNNSNIHGHQSNNDDPNPITHDYPHNANSALVNVVNPSALTALGTYADCGTTDINQSFRSHAHFMANIHSEQTFLRKKQDQLATMYGPSSMMSTLPTLPPSTLPILSPSSTLPILPPASSSMYNNQQEQSRSVRSSIPPPLLTDISLPHAIASRILSAVVPHLKSLSQSESPTVRQAQIPNGSPLSNLPQTPQPGQSATSSSLNKQPRDLIKR